MSIRSKALFSHMIVAAIACAGWVGLSPAYSQSPSSASTLSPNQIERIVGARGYQLTGPPMRHGRVYEANVVGQDDVLQRWILDAHNGRLLNQSPGDPAVRRQAANPDEWSPLARFFNGLFGHQDEVAPLSPPPASDFYETPKPKPQVKRAKLEPKPATQPATTPGDNQTASPVPEDAKPSAPPAAPPPAAAATSAKTVPAPAPETAAAAPNAPAAKTSAPKVNDVPVAPLE
jgi:hypothetical protein